MINLLFNDVVFNDTMLLLNSESVDKLVSDMINNGAFPVVIISDTNNQTLKDIEAGAPPTFSGKVTTVVFSITFKETFKA